MRKTVFDVAIVMSLLVVGIVWTHGNRESIAIPAAEYECYNWRYLSLVQTQLELGEVCGYDRTCLRNVAETIRLLSTHPELSCQPYSPYSPYYPLANKSAAREEGNSEEFSLKKEQLQQQLNDFREAYVEDVEDILLDVVL